MERKEMIEIIKNLPSDEYSTLSKKEALLLFTKIENVNAITKNELQNAIIYLVDLLFPIDVKNNT